MGNLIACSLGRAGLMASLTLVLLAAGVAAFLNLNIEAYPDSMQPLVKIVTQSAGQSAEEIESATSPCRSRCRWRHPASHQRALDLVVRPVRRAGAVYL